ncbi:DUF1858 domain-containing protein [Vulcanibacillus modesticaldus]|nr:DUF1858 domain-containing protein [Vulcanibacillus modesticaldus]
MIKKEMLIGDIVRLKPNSIDVLAKFGMGCLGCPSSQMESLEQAAFIHGLDVDKIIDELNKDEQNEEKLNKEKQNKEKQNNEE